MEEEDIIYDWEFLDLFNESFILKKWILNLFLWNMDSSLFLWIIYFVSFWIYI